MFVEFTAEKKLVVCKIMRHYAPLLSVGKWNVYQRKLGRKQAHRAMHYNPRNSGLAVSTGVWLKAKETKISATRMCFHSYRPAQGAILCRPVFVKRLYVF